MIDNGQLTWYCFMQKTVVLTCLKRKKKMLAILECYDVVEIKALDNKNIEKI